MARNKKGRRKSRSPRSNKALHGAIARVYSGIPRVGKPSSDPPVIPTFLDYSVRVRYAIRYDGNNTTSSGDFAIVNPTSSWSLGAIAIRRLTPGVVINVYLDKEDVYDAVAMRAFGGIFSTAQSGALAALKAETEFAIQSVTAWGSENVGRNTPLTLFVDFADGTPGAVVTDSGDRKSRAVAKVTASRLHWEKYGIRSPTDSFCAVRVAPPTDLLTGVIDMGVLDVLVRMRRSYNAIATAGASKDMEA